MSTGGRYYQQRPRCTTHDCHVTPSLDREEDQSILTAASTEARICTKIEQTSTVLLDFNQYFEHIKLSHLYN